MIFKILIKNLIFYPFDSKMTTVLTLEDLIGDTSFYRREIISFQYKGLFIKTWKYVDPTFEGELKPAVIAIHGKAYFY